MIEFNKPNPLYKILAAASAVGLTASFIQLIDKITILENPSASLACNINAVFSCSNILNVWQSSVFGFPNSMLCIVFFTALLMFGIIGATKGVISDKIKMALLGFTVFFVGFGFWYLWQSIFVVGGLCIYCMFCYASVLTILVSIFRLNRDSSLLSKKIKGYFKYIINNSFDILIASTIAVIIVAEILIQFT